MASYRSKIKELSQKERHSIVLLASTKVTMVDLIL